MRDERALRSVSDPLFIERSRRLGTSASTDGGEPRKDAGLEDEDIGKSRGKEMVSRKLSENEGVLRESSGFDQRTVEGGIRSRGVVEDAGEGGEIALDKMGRVQAHGQEF